MGSVMESWVKVGKIRRFVVDN